MTSIELADALLRFGTANVYEAAGKAGDLTAAIRPIVPGLRMAGIAATVRVWPGDTLGVLRAIDRGAPGTVLVVDAGAGDRVTVWGGTSSLAAAFRGMRGCLTNGCVRDVDEIVEQRFPVFAAGISPRGALKNHPGWADIPVSVGGCVIHPGDIILGDTDGVVVLPGSSGPDLLERVIEQDQRHRDRDRRVSRGESLCAAAGVGDRP